LSEFLHDFAPLRLEVTSVWMVAFHATHVAVRCTAT